MMPSQEQNLASMKKLRGNKRLDLVLFALDYHSKDRNEIQKELGLPINTYTSYNVQLILDKLIKDGFCKELKYELKYDGPEVFKPNGGCWHYSYKLTFEGQETKNKGGFKKRKIKEIFTNSMIIKEICKAAVSAFIGFMIGLLATQKNSQQQRLLPKEEPHKLESQSVQKK